MIKIHQTLHGYDQGHHLIVATALLKSSDDAQRMSLMSDWDGFDNKYDEKAEYVTAYPLMEDYYVIAKSWYAYEKPRPGCVWTQSLLIRQEDLNRIPDFKVLLKVFQRPSEENGFDYYGNIIELKEETDQEEKVPLIGDINFVNVYLSLLQGDKPLVYEIDRPNFVYQELLLHLMNYIPGAILKKYSFSSGSTMPRKMKEGQMDLQFVVNCNDGFDRLDVEKKWREFSAMDYIHYELSNGRFEIRKLLQVFEVDIKDSVDNWLQIINLFFYLATISHSDESQRKSLYLDLINAIHSSFPNKDDGTVVKTRFTLQELTKHIIDDYSFLTECCTNQSFKSFTSKQLHLEQRINSLIAEEGHSRFVDLIMEIHTQGIKTEAGLFLFAASVKLMDDNDVDRLVKEDYTVLVSMIPIDNSILNNKAWINAQKNVFGSLFAMFEAKVPDSFDYWDELFIAILKNNIIVNDGVLQIIWKCVVKPVEKVLTIINQTTWSGFLSPSISNECGKHKKEMMVWLQEYQVQNEEVARLFMSHFKVDSSDVVNTKAEEWKHFVMSGQNNDTAYYVYLYNLSFNWIKSVTSFGFFKSAFYPIYLLAQSSNLVDRYWNMISDNTVNIWIADWDKCKKMRLMASRRVLEAGLGEEAIHDFSQDKNLNQEILKYFLRMKRKKK